MILERACGASRPGQRADGHMVCLAIEGGGMRGAVSAGMCVILEAAGLIDAFDRIYGVSAGALNGCAAAAGQAAFSATYYQDAASRRVINPIRPLVRRPLVDFDFLFEELISARKPLSFDGLAHGPEFRALATSVETLTLRVLGGFAELEELMLAVRASATLPRLGGRPPIFRGEAMIDGGLVEPIPFATPIAEGATHVLVLRSRPAGYRRPPLAGLGDSFAIHGDTRLFSLVKARTAVYNSQADALERATRRRGSGPHVEQVAVPDGTRLIARLDANPERVVDALRLGAKTMASTILEEPIDLCWQPVVYRSSAEHDDARADAAQS
ncbi:MAG TPA: patatin-like phospholipase family protein [Solirubrobacteraceae bacterium]|nr:patatin-like phospholipase family protein [Solirubrobacteraceae bacterium]